MTVKKKGGEYTRFRVSLGDKSEMSHGQILWLVVSSYHLSVGCCPWICCIIKQNLWSILLRMISSIVSWRMSFKEVYYTHAAQRVGQTTTWLHTPIKERMNPHTDLETTSSSFILPAVPPHWALAPQVASAHARESRMCGNRRNVGRSTRRRILSGRGLGVM